MLKINVALPNGHAELLTLLPSSTVRDVRTKAQRAFGKKYLRLITAKNRVLVDPDKTLEESEIEDGECLTALVLQPHLAATSGAFALWGHGYSAVVTWGSRYSGGDSTAVRDQLKGVQKIQATHRAFAAILADDFGASTVSAKRCCCPCSTRRRTSAEGWRRSVVTWGYAGFGGDSSAVRDQLKGVEQIQATDGAFAAILEDGSVVTWGVEYDVWGVAYDGGDSSAVRDQLKGVLQIQATDSAFAAILEDGSVVTWGSRNWGGDSSAVQHQLRGVQKIQATLRAFAAILKDGSVVTWGHALCGGDSSAVRDQLKGVQQIQANRCAFAAILEDGSVVTWGDRYWGGDSSAVQDQLRGVQQIQGTYSAFAAILADDFGASTVSAKRCWCPCSTRRRTSVEGWRRSVVTWGDADYGGDCSVVQDQLKGVQKIQATHAAFAAILADGSVVTWGDAGHGGDSSAVRDQLKGVQQIQATERAFAAILADGSVVTWGRASCGGDSSAVQDQLKGVVQIQATDKAFAAILEDGSVVTWGDAEHGGDSSAVRDHLRFV